MNDELAPFHWRYFASWSLTFCITFFTVAMQQTLGNKNQFVEQAIKQHRNVQMTLLAQYLNQTEKKTAERMSRPTGHSRDIQYN